MVKNKIIQVQNVSIAISSSQGDDFICLTDMANGKQGYSRAADVIKNWLRNRYTLEFIGTWEQIYNPNFKVVEFDYFKTQTERLIKLNQTAINQLKSLLSSKPTILFLNK